MIDDATDSTPPVPLPPIDPARLAANWRAIELDLDVPRPSLVERCLRRLGVPASAARLALATPALRRAWFLSVAGTVFVALTAADPTAPRQSVLLYLTLAPLVGLLGVAMAYGPVADASHELHVATPMLGLRVLALRTFVVSTFAAAAIVTCTLLNAVTRPFAAAWLLPSLAVTASALALMTFQPPRRATIIVAITWCAVVAIGQLGDDPLAVFAAVGQGAAGAVAVAGAVVAFRRRAAFDHILVTT